MQATGGILRRSLGNPPGAEASISAKRRSSGQFFENPSVGILDIALALESFIKDMPERSTVDIFLTCDKMKTIVNEAFSRLLLQTIENRKITVHLVIYVSGNTKAMSRLIGTYMQPLVSGQFKLSIVHGITQAVTNQMYIIIPKKVRCFLQKLRAARRLWQLL